MKTLSTIIIITISIITLQAQDQYSNGMKKGFELWSQGKSLEASALFQRIAQAEKDNWLPSYYAANTLITASFNSEDVIKRNEMLEKAEKLIASAHAVSPENSEIITLEGMLYTAYVASEPEVYAMQYSGKITSLHAKAVELDPKNPRAHLNRIEWEMGTARFFGQDLAKFCEPLKKTKPIFEAQKKDIPFYPDYGLDRVEGALAQCGCTK